jgi:hypothetical protein
MKTKTKQEELALAIELRHVFQEHLVTALENQNAGAIVAYSVECARLRDLVMQLENEIAAEVKRS